MTPERFRLVEILYHAVLSKPTEERAAFLRLECGDDEPLLREVESLVEWHDKPGEFMEQPALECYAEFIGGEAYPLVGREIGAYKITSLIEEGGMGEVYAALETRLGRKVAIKTFRQLQAADPDRAARLWHEARSASAIKHPNVAQIYAVQEDGGHSFIVMEYVDGITLRRRLEGGPLPPLESIHIASEVAAALVAAHKAGIVHRDIKPENIMLSDDEHVKVLDFGLAKRIEPRSSEGGLGVSARFETAPGVILGTIPYMSPEQARGDPVDARTDLWSLGVTLFEMLTGQAPFRGRTPTDISAAIIEHAPPRLDTMLSDVPAELQHILDRALVKDADKRYQTASEMHADLRALRDDLTFELKAHPLPPPQPDDTQAQRGLPIGQQLTDNAQPRPLVRRAFYVFPVLLLLALSVISGVWWRKYASTPAGRFLPGNFEVRNFSENGGVLDAAISPDGRFVIYTTDENGKRNLWMKQVATPDKIPLPQPAEGSYRGLTVSRNGNHVYYSLFKDAPHGELYRVSIPAATESRKLLDDVDPPISLSPDGRRFTFIRENHERPSELVIADADGGNSRTLVADGRLVPGGVAWSPREEIIACSVRLAENGQDYRSVVGFRVGGGGQMPITNQRWKSVDRIAWLGDMSGLVLVAADEQSRLPQIWHISYPGGEARRITTDIGEYRTLSVTADSSMLATIQSMRSSRIWVGELHGSPVPRAALSSGKDEGFYGLAWTPDKRVVYTSPASGSRSLWIMNADGSGQKQLTYDGRSDRQPVVTPDGRYAIFVSDRDGVSKIWRTNIDGTDPVPLTSGPDDSFPTVSPDGKLVVYASRVGEFRSLWSVPVEGGAPYRHTSYLSHWPAFSPDGRSIACLYRESPGTADIKLAVIPFGGGPPSRIFDLPTGIAQPPDLISPGFRWSRDGRSILYVNTADGASNIWSQPVSGGQPKQLTAFTSDRIFWFDISRDDGSLVYARGQYTHDVVLITDHTGRPR